MPITERSRLAGSGFFVSLPGSPLVEAMKPQRSPPQCLTCTVAEPSPTRHSPVGSARAAVEKPTRAARPVTAAIGKNFIVYSPFGRSGPVTVSVLPAAKLRQKSEVIGAARWVNELMGQARDA